GRPSRHAARVLESHEDSLVGRVELHITSALQEDREGWRLARIDLGRDAWTQLPETLTRRRIRLTHGDIDRQVSGARVGGDRNLPGGSHVNGSDGKHAKST